MHTHSEKAGPNRSRAVANSLAGPQKSGDGTSRFPGSSEPNAYAVQRKEVGEEGPLQGKFSAEKNNNTGLPGSLKSGVENLSGFSMNDVKVHYNSSKPAQLQAHAFAQGTQIHLGPGQEKHLPHEAWHVVQQKQ